MAARCFAQLEGREWAPEEPPTWPESLVVSAERRENEVRTAFGAAIEAPGAEDAPISPQGAAIRHLFVGRLVERKGVHVLLTDRGGSTGRTLAMQVLNLTGKPVRLASMPFAIIDGCAERLLAAGLLRAA